MNKASPKPLQTRRMKLLPPDPGLADDILSLNQRNQNHFASATPREVLEQNQAHFWRNKLKMEQGLWQQDREYNFYGQLIETDQIICHIQLSQVMRGVFQAAYLGYKIDQQQQGNGYMTEGLYASIEFAFDELQLHRLMANHLPDNEASARLLQRLKFRREGYAERYLYLNGDWQDHILNALDPVDFYRN